MLRLIAVIAALSLNISSSRLLVFSSSAAAQGLGGSVDLGYVASSGNSRVETFSLGEKLTWKPGSKLTIEQKLNAIYGEADSVVNANSLSISAAADYALINGVGLVVGAGFERNRFAGIARRYEESIGLVWRFATAAADSVRVTAASVWTQQRNVDDVDDDFVALRAGIWYKRPIGSGAYFQQVLEGIPNLETSDDWRFNSETGLVAPISRNIGLKLSYVVKYDNLPEAAFQTTDRLFTAGLQITY